MKLLLENWRKFINEAKKLACPKPTQNLELNTKNRNAAIKADHIQQGGYCWMHPFKCHSARSCFTWAAGGPIAEDKVSEDWQNKGEEG